MVAGHRHLVGAVAVVDDERPRVDRRLVGPEPGPAGPTDRRPLAGDVERDASLPVERRQGLEVGAGRRAVLEPRREGDREVVGVADLEPDPERLEPLLVGDRRVDRQVGRLEGARVDPGEGQVLDDDPRGDQHGQGRTGRRRAGLLERCREGRLDAGSAVHR